MILFFGLPLMLTDWCVWLLYCDILLLFFSSYKSSFGSVMLFIVAARAFAPVGPRLTGTFASLSMNDCVNIGFESNLEFELALSAPKSAWALALWPVKADACFPKGFSLVALPVSYFSLFSLSAVFILGYVIARRLFYMLGSLFVMTILGILEVIHVLFNSMFFIFS